MKKRILSILLIIALIITNIYSLCFATFSISEEDLKTALAEQEKELNQEEVSFKATMENGVITYKISEKTFDIKYDLTDKPKFWYEGKINQGMSYDEYNKETSFFSMLCLVYYLCAKTQNVEIKDSIMYFMHAFINDTDFSSTDNKYMIISSEDSSRVLGDKYTYIKESEFGNYAMDYFNNNFKDRMIYDDSEDFKTFEATIEKKDETETSCTLMATITFNTEADFSKIKGYAESINNSLTIDSNTEETDNMAENMLDEVENVIKSKVEVSKSIENVTVTENVKTNEKKTETSKKNESSTNNSVNLVKYPNAGLEGQEIIILLIVIIVISIVSIIIILLKKQKDE